MTTAIQKTFAVSLAHAGVRSLAGPLYSAYVVLPQNHGISHLKIPVVLLNDAETKMLALQIAQKSLFFEIAMTLQEDLNTISDGISRNIQKLYLNEKIKAYTGPITVDSEEVFSTLYNLNQVEHAEYFNDSYSAAKILAAASFNKELNHYEREHHGVCFGEHKGYPTSEHLKLLKKHGITPFHRQKQAQEALDGSPLIKRKVLYPISLEDNKWLMENVNQLMLERPDVLTPNQETFMNALIAQVLQEEKVLSVKQLEIFIRIKRKLSYL